ncbi:hypothetical protein E2C01_028951 [Portunus trituberculatus]|uniref:Uncharacterized protein n=1 Tax=Portunus trituberculatus TaxID=210409 RepID=A0A5B7EQM8_PORTR|nr:hypothetical protein [Portunus trituberculatus]
MESINSDQEVQDMREAGRRKGEVQGYRRDLPHHKPRDSRDNTVPSRAYPHPLPTALPPVCSSRPTTDSFPLMIRNSSLKFLFSYY